MFRKCVRLGKVLLNLNSIYVSLNSESKLNYALIFNCLSIFSETLYCIVDHFILFDKIKAWQFSSSTMDFVKKWEDPLWVYETVFGIISDFFKLYKIYNILNNNKNVKNSDENLNTNKGGETLLNEEEMNKLKVETSKILSNQIRLWSDLFVSINLNKVFTLFSLQSQFYISIFWWCFWSYKFFSRLLSSLRWIN